ncbi:uncharacterized protein F4822DRAFT_840 [Hypoxylon trugodes]|uniref:uncharacterized protein n=1 Tax=Hypoxylon trugodes TaxID=326681 RepID=UPI00219B45FF|nr:uncharacterized protein F4822DRAFT_840 [Hypoxylon trugodes]KAI1393125.1 hypothetical protein F4822DRAFT_840 [Hypoxylon trugodes]
MSLEKIEIPVPRLRRRAGGITLLISLAVVVVLSAKILYEHIYILKWIEQHDVGNTAGFKFWSWGNDRVDQLAWLPQLLYRGPHHQLAIAASAVGIAASLLVFGLFYASVSLKKNFGQHWILILIWIPTLTLFTTALLYNFIEHGTTGRINTWTLYRKGSPDAYNEYVHGWLDFESWSCGLREATSSIQNETLPWKDTCYRSELGRWLLLPAWFAICGAILVSWFAFRGLPGWRGNDVDENEVEGDEGRVRLL